MRYLALLILALPLTLLAVVLLAVLAPVVRLAGRLLLAALATLVAAAFGVHEWGLVAVFLGTAFLLSGGVRVRRERPRRRAAAEQVVDQSPAPAASTVLDKGPAWRELRGLADWRTRRRLDAAADACGRYLLLAETQEDPSAQLPIKIARHAPTVVADCVRHSRTATSAERQALLADTLATLESLAARAEARRRELAHQAQGNFRTLRTHLNTPED